MGEAKRYIKAVYQEVMERDPHQTEFLQAVKEFFNSIEPVLERHPRLMEENILSRIVEPERIIQFRVPWTDAKGKLK